MSFLDATALLFTTYLRRLAWSRRSVVCVVLAALAPDVALLSFSVPSGAAYKWGNWLTAISSRGTRVYRLPERDAIETKINDLKSAAQSDDLTRIQKASQEVEQAFHALSQQLYAQGQPQPNGQGPSGPAASGPQGDVIDGEVKE